MSFAHGQVNRNKNTVEAYEFRLKTGTSQVRVLPPHPTSDSWFVRVYEHWVDNGTVPCPRQFNRECPICEEGETLYNSGVESQISVAKELRPREAFYYNVVVFSTQDGKVSPKNGVVVMKSGVKVYRQLKDLDNDEAGGWGDMTNVNTGFDVRITRSGEGKNDTEYRVQGVPFKSGPVALKDSLAQHGVDLDSLVLVNLNEYIETRCLGYEELRTKVRNKRVAPGFPSGPRMSAEPTYTAAPAPVAVNLDVAPPPVVEEA